MMQLAVGSRDMHWSTGAGREGKSGGEDGKRAKRGKGQVGKR